MDMNTVRFISAEQARAADRLKALWNAKKKGKVSQENASMELGWSGSALSQYLNGHIALNLPALVRLSAYLGVQPDEIYPELAAELTGDLPLQDKGINQFYLYEVMKIIHAQYKPDAWWKTRPEVQAKLIIELYERIKSEAY